MWPTATAWGKGEAGLFHKVRTAAGIIQYGLILFLLGNP